jgi:hypothetical protein
MSLLSDMSVEGIFRKNGNIRRLKDLTDAIDRDPSSVDLTLDNPVQLAALLKKFLRELPDPLMTFKLHRLFIASQCMFDSVVFGIKLSLLFESSPSRGFRSDAIPPYVIADPTKESSGYYGSTFCLPEMGSIFCTYGLGDGK